jgi:hypothetical protein
MNRRIGRGGGERGASIVETALVTPLFLFLVLALVEYGVMYRDHLTLANTTRDAARTATVVGQRIDADHRILDAVVRASAAVPRRQIEEVVIFRAAAVDAPVPTACLSAPVAGLCNRYTNLDLARPSGDFGCGAASPDRFWCPTGRVTALRPVNGGPPELIGVHVVLERPGLTGLLPGTQRLRNSFVLRLEPSEL